MDKFTKLTECRRAAADHQYRHRHDHPQAVSQDDQAHRPRHRAVFGDALQRGRHARTPDFVLNKPAYRQAKIIVAGDNFGCGSSREHAPWALLDFGVTLRHLHQLRRHFLQQLLQERHPAGHRRRPPSSSKLLMDDAERGSNATLTVDLEAQTISRPGRRYAPFRHRSRPASRSCSKGSTTSPATLKARPGDRPASKSKMARRAGPGL